MSKKYTTNFLEDTNGSTGTTNQVLVSTATGVDWVDASTVIGGPYLPLAGGTITGNLTVNGTANIGNQLTFPYGSIGDYIYHTGDGDTFYGFPTNDTFIVATSGTERMRINSSGNVGIGTTSPSAKLDVRRGSSGIVAEFHSTQGVADEYVDIKLISGNTTAGTYGTILRHQRVGAGGADFAVLTNPTLTGTPVERFRITRDGNVGIGTTSPSYPLDVVGNARMGATLYIGTRVQGLTGGSYSNLILNDLGGNVGIGTTSPLHKLHVNGASDGNSIYTAMLQNTGTAAGTASKLLFVQGGSTIRGAVLGGLQESASGSPTSMVFETSAAYATPTERMRITSAGNVGIGTTSPDRQLQIHESTSGTSTAKFTNSTTGEDGDTGFFVGINGSEQPILYGYNNTDMIIGTNGSERMRITSAGKVGIGTTTTDSKLNISGGSGDPSATYSTTAANSIIGIGNFSASGLRMMLGVNPNTPSTWIQNQYTTNQVTASLLLNPIGGNVGIGTTAPNYKLEVNNTSAGNLTTALTLNNGSTTTNTAVALRLQTDPTSTVNSYSEIRSTRTNSPAAGGVAMQFLATNSTTGAASEIMRLSYVGLGLGTAGTTTITDTRRGAFADGTAAAPAYSFSDDTNNGMYRITTDTLGFSTAGTEKLRISSAGNVGIGTTNPSEKLDVNGNLIVSGNFNNLYVGGKTNSNVDGIRMLCAGDDSYIDCRGGSGLNFRLDDTTGDTQRIKFHSGGNVSIGNTNNSYKLDVTGTGNFAGNLQISTVDQQTTRLLLKNTNSTGGRTFALVGGVHNETQDGFSIYDTVAAATRFTILNNGNVGIGTTSPGYQLQLSTNSAAKPTSNVWTVVSDSRVKENVRTYDSGLDKVLQIEPKLFDYNGKAGFEKTKDNVGIIAQEIKKILPETVNTYKAKLNEGDEEETELYSYDGHALTFALVNSIKELNKKIEKLETRIQTLENKQL
jgi:hypothetical protein